MARTPTPPCPLSENGKHRYEWVRNAVKQKIGAGSIAISAVGIYKCACKRIHWGRVRVGEPGDSL